MMGCKGITTAPTDPNVVTPTPAPNVTTPTPAETPGQATGEGTPTPTEDNYDGYADTPDSPTIRTLEPDDDEPYLITMEYSGDIDWYKIDVPQRTGTLSINLTDIPQNSDFDIVAYDEELNELENGRSTQSGNASESLILLNPEELLYLQIYSYSGRGNATLTITSEERAEGADDSVEPEISQLTYEEVLSTYFPLYPRGSSSGLLEHTVETIEVEQVACKYGIAELSGDLTIGNYAHVERDVLTLTDYVDGWSLVVFNGSQQMLDAITVTIRVSIWTSGSGLDITVPFEMQIDGSDYTVSDTDNDVYYLATSYGDLLSNSSNDILISSGVVGDLSSIVGNDGFFTQQVEVDWEATLSDGSFCSGSTFGKQIDDFEIAKLLFLTRYEALRPQ
jgi:hypothetical protein